MRYSVSYSVGLDAAIGAATNRKWRGIGSTGCYLNAKHPKK